MVGKIVPIQCLLRVVVLIEVSARSTFRSASITTADPLGASTSRPIGINSPTTARVPPIRFGNKCALYRVHRPCAAKGSLCGTGGNWRQVDMAQADASVDGGHGDMRGGPI